MRLALAIAILITVLRAGLLCEPARGSEASAQPARRPDAPRPDVHRLPPTIPSPDPRSKGEFPALPPDPYETLPDADLPSLQEELLRHNGAHMYHTGGSVVSRSDSHEESHDSLRLPEDWIEPRPWTLFAPFLGTGPIHSRPGHLNAYGVEPRFVAYGSYEMFAFAFEQDDVRRDAIGHQLLVDLNLQLTGTERFHVQFRPLGEGGTGGSFYQFNDPSRYVSNSTGEPQRYWFETELHSWLGPGLDPFGALDMHLVAGRIPFLLQNGLLMNDEILAFVANQNTIFAGNLTNLNAQFFYAFNDVGTFEDADARAVGINLFADYERVFYELNLAYSMHDVDSRRDSYYLALGRTKSYGPTTVALRGLFKFGDRGGRGNGELFVLESNRPRYFSEAKCGVEKAVFYCNAFWASEGWNSLGGGNFNRLRTAFEVDPLTRISSRPVLDDTLGLSCGVQLFRHHEDESLVPEVSVELPGGTAVWGIGLRYFRKTGPRSFLEVLGVYNESDDAQFDRHGVFVSETIIF